VTPAKAALVSVSAVFFIYPVHFLVTTLWTLQTEVRNVLTGRVRISTASYTNVRRPVYGYGEYLPITVNVPVYTEANEVIFETLLGALAAVKQYQRATGQLANVVVCDDGLAKMLNLPLSERALAMATGPAAERIAFYRQHGIGFVARPAANRPGKFKKAGNLNFTYGLSRALGSGAEVLALTAPGGAFEGGWAEGNVTIHELICLLDKDSGMVPGVLEATAPEFWADPNLAFTQHVTKASNPDENYFTWLQARFTETIYRVCLPSKALQGLQVHLMGHNAFLRRSFLEGTGDWPEDRVSEDYAKALEAYSNGWHGKLIDFEGLEFTEQVCSSFSEEATKQRRYCYGMSELIMDRHPLLRGTIKADLVIHYLSYINLGAALPMVLALLFSGQVYYLFAGMVVNSLIFMVVPVLQAQALGKAAGFGQLRETVVFFALSGLAFVGYSHAMLAGHWTYLVDSYKGTYEPFTATSVAKIEHSRAAGWALLKNYARDNWVAAVAIGMVAIGSVALLYDQPPHIIRPIMAFFLLGHVLAPLLLTPQLFAGRAGQTRRLFGWHGSRRPVPAAEVASRVAAGRN
jgi:cellulose synthase/poly-beta-1,6-N-acetylglucosamine synthase-like glycosyltransferase